MNKVDLNIALPKQPEWQAPPRASSNFQEQLQEDRQLTPRQPEKSPQEHENQDSTLAKHAHTVALTTQSVISTELYGFSSIAMQRLSYRTVDNAEPTPLGTVTDLQGSTGKSAPFSSTSNADLQVRPLSSTPHVDRSWLPISASKEMMKSVTDESHRMTHSTNTVVDTLLTRLLRKLTFLPTEGGMELIVRNIEDTNTTELTATLREHCHQQGIPLVRIVLNGQTVWTQSRSTNHAG